MTKTDIGIYRGLKEKFDPEVHVGFFITTDTGELLLGDQSLGQTISGWEINDGVLILKLNTGKDIRVTFPEATETVKGLLSAADKAQLNALQANLDSKVDKVTGKSLLADSEIEKLAGLPNSTELTNSIATAKAAGDNAQSDLNAHKQNKSNPHEVTKDQVGLGNVTNDAQVKRSEMGVANGVATLDADGKVPASQLPSYVDDIIDVYATYSKSDTGVLSNVTLYLDAAHTQLVTGEAGKIYQNIADGEPQYQFRWTGTIFSQTGASSLILGEVTGTAYDGAKGKANADNIAKIKGTSLSHIKDAAPVTTAADKVSINYECFEGDQYGAAGTDHTADIPAATTAKAGVMSAADKTKLENLNSKLVVADEEDVTAVDGKIKFKDRDTTNGMGYKILRLPENGILTQDMINQADTIYEIRYNFDLNGATITIPENCTLKFEGGKLSNGTLNGAQTSVDAPVSYILENVTTTGSFITPAKVEWFGAKSTTIIDDYSYNNSPSIQAALDSAFQEIDFSIGIYNIDTTLVVSKNQLIRLIGTSPQELDSKYGLPFNKNIINSTIITTSKNVDLLHVYIQKNRDSNYDNHQRFSIIGGSFDVTRNSVFNSTVIKIILTEGVELWDSIINTSIFGNVTGYKVIQDFSSISSVGIELAHDETNLGSMYIATIDSHIKGFAYGFKNSIEVGSDWSTSFDFKGLIEGCNVMIDFGPGIGRSRVYSTFQSNYWFGNKEACMITGSLKNVHIASVNWDLQLSSTTSEETPVYSHWYLCDLKTNDDITVSDNVKSDSQYFKGDVQQVYSGKIFPKYAFGFPRTHREVKSYLELVNNDLLGWTNYTVESQNIPDGYLNDVSPFSASQTCRLLPQSNISGASLTFTVNLPEYKNLRNFIVTVPINCPGYSISWSKIVIEGYDQSNSIVCTQELNNSPVVQNNDISVILYTGRAHSNVVKVVVKLIDLLMTDAQIGTSSYIFMEGSFLKSDYSHIGTRERVETKRFLLDGFEYARKWVKNSGTALYNVSENYSFMVSNNNLVFNTFDDVKAAFKGDTPQYNTGARATVNKGNRYVQVFGSIFNNKQDCVLYDSDGYPAEASKFGSTIDRPSGLRSIDYGFTYFDTTLNRPVYWNGTKWVDPAEDSIKWRTIE